MKKLIRSKSDTKLITDYKLVSESLNTNINNLKTDYLKKGHLLPKSSIFTKRKYTKRSNTNKNSNIIK